MKELKIGKMIITYDPFYAQLINNHLYQNTGYVLIKNKNKQTQLADEIILSGGDLLGYRIFHCFRKLCVYARGTNKCYFIDKTDLHVVKEIIIDGLPKKLYFKNNSYYILYNNNDIKYKIIDINEVKNFFYYLYVYRFFLIALTIFPLIFLCMYFLK
jgi:hypothetical protein